VVARQLYHPYGDTRWQDGTLPTDFGFDGQRHDGSTGLVFMHARYYHAGLGRFTQADTVVPVAGEPQDLNRYAYVRNSPLNYRDPSGHAVDSYGNSWSVVDCPMCEPPSPEKVRETVVFMATGVAFAFAPEVIAVAPESYVWSAILSEVGYIGGSVATGQEVDPVDMALAFYVGGLSPGHFGIHPATLARKVGANALWGGANNLTQYGISCAIHGDSLSGDEAYRNLVGGGLAGALGTGAEEGLTTLAGRGTEMPWASAALRGAARISSPVSDVSAQWATYSLSSQHSARSQSLTVDLYTASPASLGSYSAYDRQSQSPDVFPWLR